jgi:hypothetical protein
VVPWSPRVSGRRYSPTRRDAMRDNSPVELRIACSHHRCLTLGAHRDCAAHRVQKTSQHRGSHQRRLAGQPDVVLYTRPRNVSIVPHDRSQIFSKDKVGKLSQLAYDSQIRCNKRLAESDSNKTPPSQAHSCHAMKPKSHARAEGIRYRFAGEEKNTLMIA